MSSEWVTIAIVILGTLNLIRVATVLVATDIYDIRRSKPKPPEKKGRLVVEQPWPHITVIIPAYNEAFAIYRSLESVTRNQYPHYDVLVVDDGSSDNTSSLVKLFIEQTKATNVRLLRQKNAGKAAGLNKAIKYYARGSLVMCLDADSKLGPTAIREAAKLFRDNPSVIAMASNVHVTNTGSFLGLAQKFEYLLSYRGKKALTELNMEYIIGGVGSTFRKSFLKKVGYYDEDTMTEDIDLTMKLAGLGNIKHRLAYGAKVHTYTEGVMGFRDLVKQRFRWKFGRMQTLYKNRELIFNQNKKYSKALTIFQLPYAIVGEFNLLLEPLFVGFILIQTVLTQNYFALQWIIAVMAVYMVINIIGSESINRKEKFRLTLLMPVGYYLFYVLSLVEFIALLRSLVRLPKLSDSLKASSSKWEHVQRVQAS